MAPTAAATRATAGAQKSGCPRGTETGAYRPARPRPPTAITLTDTGAGDLAAAEAVGIGRTSIRTYPATIGMLIGEMTGMRRLEETRGMCSPGETTGAGGTNETRDGTTGIGDVAILTIGRGIVGREVGAARRFAIAIGRGTGIGIEIARCIAGSKCASAGSAVGREGKGCFFDGNGWNNLAGRVCWALTERAFERRERRTIRPGREGSDLYCITKPQPRLQTTLFLLLG